MKDKWCVYFDTNFWGSDREDAEEKYVLTTEYPLNQDIEWYGEKWRLLSAYSCKDGLVIDYCIQVEPRALQAFVEEFQKMSAEHEHFEQLQLKNPTAPNVRIDVFRGEEKLESLGSSGMHYAPIVEEGMEKDELAESCLLHYGLDSSYAYSFYRAHFQWDEGREEDFSELSVCFFEDLVSVPGEHLTLSGEKQEFALTHPLSGKQYQLKIEQIEKGELSEEHLSHMDQTMCYPTHFESVYYTLEPDCEDGSIMLQSCEKGDSPIRKTESTKVAAAISVIGGACGPTSVFLLGNAKGNKNIRCACSPLCFVPTPVREWFVVYRVQRREPYQVSLNMVE